MRGLGSPGAVRRSADGSAALFTVLVSSPKDSVTTVDTRAVTAVRQPVAAAARRAGDGLEAAVTGDAAATADSGSTTADGVGGEPCRPAGCSR
jgi:MMPL family